MNGLRSICRALKYQMRASASRGRIELGRGVMFRARLDIRGAGKVIIGDDVYIDAAPGDPLSFVTIYTHAPDAVVTIGPRTRLYGARISCRHAVSVGPDGLIEEAGIADTDFHALDPRRGPPIEETLERCRVTIGERVSLGARSLVAKGVTIASDVVVCPGAVVTRSLPAGVFAAGNPARVVDLCGVEGARLASL
jgi:maltose O-acetyltransferase